MPTLMIKELAFEISEEDKDLLGENWWLINGIYPQTRLREGGKRVQLSRLIMQRMREGQKFAHWERVFYIDGNPCNNRRENLSLKRNSEAPGSRPVYSSSRSGVSGLVWSEQTQAWQLRINFEGKRIYLGHWGLDHELATKARDYAIARLTNRLPPENLPEFAVKKLDKYLKKHLKS